jgi:hypothetical protein
MSVGGNMLFEIYESGRKTKQLSFFEFVDFYYDEFGVDCGNPSAIAHALEEHQGNYIGKGYTVFKSNKTPEEAFYTKPMESYCAHPKKYLNVITNSLQFYVCPDCKKEV